MEWSSAFFFVCVCLYLVDSEGKQVEENLVGVFKVRFSPVSFLLIIIIKLSSIFHFLFGLFLWGW